MLGVCHSTYSSEGYNLNWSAPADGINIHFSFL